jgi:hypothetical protein
MIPTLIVLGLVLGRWWRLLLVTAALGWPLLLVADGVMHMEFGLLAAAALAVVNAHRRRRSVPPGRPEGDQAAPSEPRLCCVRRSGSPRLHRFGSVQAATPSAAGPQDGVAPASSVTVETRPEFAERPGRDQTRDASVPLPRIGASRFRLEGWESASID